MPNDLPITDGGCVPVFDCHVFVSPPDERGVVRARCANLAGVEGHGPTERDALATVAKQFKAIIREHHESGTEIPFVDPRPSPLEGESERWLPVHL